MNFTSRTTLGNKLAQRLERLKGKDAVIVCLQESSLMTCLAMATHLRAWIFPLVYGQIYEVGGSHALLGAYDTAGEFFADPEGPASDEKVTPEIAAACEKQREAAMEQVRTLQKSYDMQLDSGQLAERHVVLCADVLATALPLTLAGQLFKSIRPKSLTAAVGNVSPEVAEKVRMSAGESEILDIISGIVYDDIHYFEVGDTFDPNQQHALARNIAAYWE